MNCASAVAELTAAGREFEHYALSLLKLWEEARQQIAVPEGYTDSLCIGAQYSLWPQLGFLWLDEMRRDAPAVSLRAELGMPDRLTRFLIEGVAQIALIHTPQARPGLALERILEERLVLVAPWTTVGDGDIAAGIAGRYAFIDWGSEFVRAHALHLPELTNPGLTLSLGAMAADYLVARGLAGYMPARAVSEHLAARRLHLVPGAPVFPYPVWVVWREDLADAVRLPALAALRRIAARVDALQTEIVGTLEAAPAATSHGE